MNGGMRQADSDPLPTTESVMNLSHEDCQLLWSRLFQTPIPPRASLHFLRGNIAWAIQAQATGEDPLKLRRSFLRKLETKPRFKSAQEFKPGTRLVRAWNGKTHEVIVLESGYQWRGDHYRSLSHIAREITGTQWSGPRFFGLIK